MALAVNGSGTIFKKCDRSNHRPDSNKGCASSICQHTCDTPERCHHAWTLRYWVNGKQVEKSFKDKQHPTTGRVEYGSGKKLARDWQLKLTVDKRSGDITFTDHSKSGKQNFGEACEQFIARMRVGENSRDRYLHSYRTYVRGVFGGKTLAQVAQDRDGVTEHLTVIMKHLSNTPRLAAVRDDRRRKEHCQGRVDTGPAPLTAPEAIGCDADAVELGRSADTWPAPGPHVLAFHEDESVGWSDSFTPFCC
jgi:hypothetical protein